MMIDFRGDQGVFEFTLNAVGKGKATTFKGFCQKHDKSVFQPIEDSPYCGTSQQNFLFALRGLAKEYSEMKATVRMYEYLFNVFSNKDYNALRQLHPSFEDASRIERLTEWTHLAYQSSCQTFAHLERLKNRFNEAHSSCNHAVIRTDAFAFPKEFSIAVSSAIIIDNDFDGKMINDTQDASTRQKYMFISLFPQNRRTYLLLSYLEEDASTFAGLIQHLRNQSHKKQLVIISNIIALYIDNFVLSPQLWRSLPDEHRNTFLQLYDHPLFQQRGPLLADHRLNIFVKPFCNDLRQIMHHMTCYVFGRGSARN